MPDRSEASRRSALDIRGFPGIRRLAADYADSFDSLAPFFAGDPRDPRAWNDAIARTRAYDRARETVSAVLARQQERRGAPAEARRAATLLARPETVAVVTGQQAGLFGGPLYTLLKALDAVNTAARLSREHSVDAVAVFWVEGEDHDWDEAGSCPVLDSNLELRTISLPRPSGAGTMPVATLVLDESIEGTLAELGGVLPATEFTQALLSDLAAVYTPGTGMAEAFARWLEKTLGGRGLIVFDASDPASKPPLREVFARELKDPGRSARLAREAGDRLVALGYHAQFAPHRDSAGLFRLDGGRQAIRPEDDSFVVAGSPVERQVLIEAARNEPERFSPNVLLRPVAQDTLFPTVAYVAGPNELAYLAQLRGVYERFGVPMPLVSLRTSLTILDSASARFLSRYGLPLTSLASDSEAWLNEMLERQLPAPVEGAYREARDSLEAKMETLIAALPQVDPTLQGAGRTTLGRMRHDLETLHAKIINAAKRRDETLRRQFRHARALAFPGGHPQERAVHWVYFLNQYGDVLVDRLSSETETGSGRHLVVTI